MQTALSEYAQRRRDSLVSIRLTRYLMRNAQSDSREKRLLRYTLRDEQWLLCHLRALRPLSPLEPERKPPSSPPPFSAGQWVAETVDCDQQIARIKEVYWDSIACEWVMDLVIYAHDGKRLGRTSPRGNGPASVEPCVPCQYWRRIDEPRLPLYQ